MLQVSVDWVLFSFCKLNPQVKWVQALNFFIYDSVKILLLLFFLIWLIGCLRSYLSTEKVKQWLAGKKSMANLLAAVFGAVTPFCSCSSIPIFISFLKAGIPLGVTFSFLITSPIVNEYLVILMLGFFGFKIALLYVVSGIAIGTICGMVLGKMNLEKNLASDLFREGNQVNNDIGFSNFRSRLSFGFKEAKSILVKLWIWILAGVGLGALIHNFIPQEFVRNVISKSDLLSVPIATLIGVPMYGNCAAIVPIAVALFQKGFPLGTALSFMMAVSALSLPEAIMLRRAMNLKLIMIFFAITTLGIIFTGYLFNYLQTVLI